MTFRFQLFAWFMMIPSAAVLAATQPAQPARPGHTTPHFANQVYATVGGKPLRLDLYLPKTPTSSTLPLVINIHGGGWSKGSKAACPYYVMRMLQLGFAVASVDYRLTGEGGKWGGAPVVFPAQIHDIKGAVRFLRANAGRYHLDPERFAVWGGSAGGHLAALLATSGGAGELEGEVGGNLNRSSRVQAAVDFYGPTDLLHIPEDALADHTPAPDASSGSPVIALIGMRIPPGEKVDPQRLLADPDPPYAEARRLLTLANPITFADPGDPPMFIGHATGDFLVPVSQSRRLDEALKKAGVRSRLMITRGGGHGVLDLETEIGAMQFLCETLNPQAAAHLPALIAGIRKQPPRRPSIPSVKNLLKLFQ